MATVKEVALLADVSPSTVSNVLSGRVTVRDKTRQRVLSAAETLGYIPNLLASNLRLRETRLVAFSVGDIANPSNGFLVRGASDVLVENGYHPLLFSCDEDPQQEQDALVIAAQQRVAGILLSATGQASTAYEWLIKLGVTVVCVDRSVPGLDTDIVRSNDALGFRKATEHLLAEGHRRIAMISGPVGSAVSAERIRGYREALQARKIPLDADLIQEGQSKERFGYAALLRLIALPEPPSAVLAASTRLTLGVLYAMRDHAIARPSQMVVVGSGASDVQWLSLFAPPLMLLSIPSRLCGQKAAELLVERMTHRRSGPGEEFLIEPELVMGTTLYTLDGLSLAYESNGIQHAIAS